MYSPPSIHASCEVKSPQGTYANGAFIGGDFCDTNGNKYVTLGGVGTAGGLGTATAAAPTLAEGSGANFSFDLANNARFTLGTLLSGEDQTNNLMMVSGGATRITQLVGTGGVPSTASDATTTATILPVGKKTFHSVVTCTGTCVQTQKIYGAFESSATVAKSTLVCTLTNNASTTATDWCATDLAYSYWFVVTSATSGTTPLAGLFAMY
jgi:hypothetical protein